MTAGEKPIQTTSPERAAAMVAGITVASRVFGFIRVLAATAILGVTFLGNTYATANSVPNVIFEIFAGGALAAVIVPALTTTIVRGDRAETERTASSFGNLALLILTPLVLGGMVFRGPLMQMFTSGVDDPAIRLAERRLGEFLLLLFLPQVWLYSAGIVLTGVLHAHRRFGWPAAAPLLSSIVVTISYIVYALVEGDSASDVTRISNAGRLILGAGTTAGVAALSLALLIPARKLGLRWRRVIQIPAQARALAGKLLTAAALAVGGQHLLLGVVLVIANRVEGGVVAYQLAFTILLLPWATLAVPVASASFPGLAEASLQETAEFARRCSQALRTTTVLVCGGAAILVAVADPMSRVILSFGAAGGLRAARIVVPTVLAFGPGLIGYGLFALLTRVAFARGDGRSASIAAVVAFGTAALGDVIAAQILTGPSLIASLAAAFSLGMLLAAGLLIVRLRGSAGRAAIDAVPITVMRAVAAGLIAAAVGLVLGTVLPGGRMGLEFASGLIIVALCVAIYAGALRFLGDRELRRAVVAIRRS